MYGVLLHLAIRMVISCVSFWAKNWQTHKKRQSFNSVGSKRMPPVFLRIYVGLAQFYFTGLLTIRPTLTIRLFNIVTFL